MHTQSVVLLEFFKQEENPISTWLLYLPLSFCFVLFWFWTWFFVFFGCCRSCFQGLFIWISEEDLQETVTDVELTELASEVFYFDPVTMVLSLCVFDTGSAEGLSTCRQEGDHHLWLPFSEHLEMKLAVIVVSIPAVAIASIHAAAVKISLRGSEKPRGTAQPSCRIEGDSYSVPTQSGLAWTCLVQDSASSFLEVWPHFAKGELKAAAFFSPSLSVRLCLALGGTELALFSYFLFLHSLRCISKPCTSCYGKH